MINQAKKRINDTQLWIIIASVALVLALTVGAISFIIGNSNFRSESLEKDVIIQNLEEYKAKLQESSNPKNHSSVADALSDLGFAVNKKKFKNVELAYEQYFYKELPSIGELTVSCATLYLEHFYDTIPKDNKSSTTVYMLKCYVRSVGDPYSEYYTQEEYAEFMGSMTGTETKVGIGVMLQANYEENTMKITSVLPGSAAEIAGIVRGDYIVAIDGQRVADVGIDTAMTLVAGEVGTTVKITVLRGSEEIEIPVIRAQLSDVTVTGEMLEGNIAYVQVIQFKENTPSQFMNKVAELKAQGAVGFVFDMRGNPGGSLDAVVEMIDYIVPDGHRIASYTIGQTSKTVYTSDDGYSLDLPVTVLCNGGTASAGELFTAALRDFGEWGLMDVCLVGEQTYGKGVMQSSFNINNGEGLKLTMAFYNPPCDVNYDGIGVLDVSKPNQHFVQNEGDEDTQLAVAIERLNDLINAKNGVDEPQQ